MGQAVHINLDVPAEYSAFRLPRALHRRLQFLLDAQDNGNSLTTDEREEAEGLVDLSELLTVLRMRAERVGALDS